MALIDTKEIIDYLQSVLPRIEGEYPEEISGTSALLAWIDLVSNFPGLSRGDIIYLVSLAEERLTE